MPINTEALALISKINRELGEGTVVLANEIKEPPRFTSGSLFIDLALGGGWPANQWVEVYGKESNGKTAVTLKTIAANQQRDPDFTTLWIASEHYDIDQASALGVDNERMIVIPTQDMVFAYDKVVQFAQARAVDCVVIDSYPALVPPDEERKDVSEEARMAGGAQKTGLFFRKVGPAMHRSEGERPILGIFINQQRDKIGGWAPVGTPQTTPGGNAKNYAFYTRLEVKRDEWIEEKVKGKDLKVKVGQTIKVTTTKNKSAAPGQVAVVDFYFRESEALGFRRGEYDVVRETFVLSLLFDIIIRKGAYFIYGDRRWQGKDAVVLSLREEPDLLKQLDDEVRQIALHQFDGQISEEAVDEATKAGTRTVSRG